MSSSIYTCMVQLQVKCDIASIPAELCELPRLQLLNLSHNWKLQQDGYSNLANAPLHKVLSCAGCQGVCSMQLHHYAAQVACS